MLQLKSKPRKEMKRRLGVMFTFWWLIGKNVTEESLRKKKGMFLS
jgi:hypothetical protein